MVMWLRLGGALLITVAALALLEYFGVKAISGGRTAEEVHHDSQARLREVFWLAVFALVMAGSLLAAVRRSAGRLRRAAGAARSRDV